MNKLLGLFTALVLTIVGISARAVPLPVKWSASREPASVALSKRDTLAKLKILQDKQIAEGTELENAIRKQLNQTMKLEVGNDDLEVAGRRTNLVTKKIDELNKRRQELNAKREIVDRLIFQIDSKWDGHSSLKEFLTTTFIEMASTDLSEGRDNRLWKEFTYQSMVMREVPEKNEDVIALFEGYLNSGSVLDPRTPAEFMATRNYTNGAESMQAHAGERSTLGDGMGSSSPGLKPQVIRATIASDMVPQPPQIVKSAGSLKTPVETAERAQLDSGQVPLSAAAPAGTNDGANAAPLAPASAIRANTTTSATSQSAADLAAHADKTPGATPTPVPPAKSN